MYIYKISNYWYDEDIQDCHYGLNYVVSDKKYSVEDFESMCEECIKIEGRAMCNIPKFLIEKYGFNYIPIECKFEYDEDEE